MSATAEKVTQPAGYALPGQPGATVQFKAKYDNFIGGKWVAPMKLSYFALN